MSALPSYLKVVGIEGNLRGATVAWDWTWSGTEHGIAPPNILPDKDRCIVTNQALAGFEYVQPNAGVLTLTPRLVCNGVETTLDPVTMRVGMNFVEPVGPCCVGMIDPGECGPCGCTTAMTWGENYYGTLGDGAYPNSTEQDDYSFSIYPALSIQAPIVDMACGGAHTMFIAADCSVWGVGGNYSGQLGDVETFGLYLWTPINIAVSDVKSIATGTNHTLFLKSDGTVWGCGQNNYGQLGTGVTGTSSSEIVQAQIFDVVAIAAGYRHSVFLKSDGTVWACGYNYYGQLGNGTATDVSSPIQSVIDDVVKIACGRAHTLFLKSDGTVWGCGQNNYGQLGTGVGTTREVVPAYSLINDVISFDAGDYHSVALKSDGTVWGCGYNGYGQLGKGDFSNAKSFSQSNISSVIDLACGSNHTIFLKSDGAVFGSGRGSDGQLGNGSLEKSPTPVASRNIVRATKVFAGGSYGYSAAIVCEYDMSCEDYFWHVVAEQITSLDPEDDYPETWDLTPYKQQVFTPGYVWEFWETSYGVIYASGVVNSQGVLEGLPDSFTTTQYYQGYMEIKIQCREPIPNE